MTRAKSCSRTSLHGSYSGNYVRSIQSAKHHQRSVHSVNASDIITVLHVACCYDLGMCNVSIILKALSEQLLDATRTHSIYNAASNQSLETRVLSPRSVSVYVNCMQVIPSCLRHSVLALNLRMSWTKQGKPDAICEQKGINLA